MHSPEVDAQSTGDKHGAIGGGPGPSSLESKQIRHVALSNGIKSCASHSGSSSQATISFYHCTRMCGHRHSFVSEERPMSERDSERQRKGDRERKGDRDRERARERERRRHTDRDTKTDEESVLRKCRCHRHSCPPQESRSQCSRPHRPREAIRQLRMTEACHLHPFP